jgi:hypothetical protein
MAKMAKKKMMRGGVAKKMMRGGAVKKKWEENLFIIVQ